MRLLLVLSALAWLAVEPPVPNSASAPLVFSGGHDTDPRDRGRPVVLVAAALKVSPEVFREAFLRVHPAPAGRQPQPEQLRANKAALMAALGPYGVTNDRLDEVSNYYRYRRSASELWRHRDASGYATLFGGKITGFVLADGGAGYSSVPSVSVGGVPAAVVRVEMYWGPDLARNGSSTAITPVK